jgi:hypothetical protein
MFRPSDPESSGTILPINIYRAPVSAVLRRQNFWFRVLWPKHGQRFTVCGRNSTQSLRVHHPRRRNAPFPAGHGPRRCASSGKLWRLNPTSICNGRHDSKRFDRPGRGDHLRRCIDEQLRHVDRPVPMFRHQSLLGAWPGAPGHAKAGIGLTVVQAKGLGVSTSGGEQ